MANLFAGSPGKNSDNSMPSAPPPLHTRSSQNDAYTNDRPSTPIRNNFTTPVSTPQGSPSKNRNPPGAFDLPTTFDNAMKLYPATNTYGTSPLKLDRPQGNGIPLSPGKGQDETSYSSRSGNNDDSVLHKSPGSPLKKQANENTPPISRGLDLGTNHNLAAQQRQAGYQPADSGLARENSTPTIRKYNTQRGLTPEELELLQKPNVKRLANVTQLCKHHVVSIHVRVRS